MKKVHAFLLILVYPTIAWCQSDSTMVAAPGIFHLSAVGTIDSAFLGGKFTVRSMVSPESFDQWNTAELKRMYEKGSVLIVVARQDNDKKTKFVLSFYRHWLNTGSKQRAYELAIEEAGSPEIKHLLILNEP